MLTSLLDLASKKSIHSLLNSINCKSNCNIFHGCQTNINKVGKEFHAIAKISLPGYLYSRVRIKLVTAWDLKFIGFRLRFCPGIVHIWLNVIRERHPGKVSNFPLANSRTSENGLRVGSFARTVYIPRNVEGKSFPDTRTQLVRRFSRRLDSAELSNASRHSVSILGSFLLITKP